MSGSGEDGSWIAKLGAALFTLIASALGKFAGGWETILGNLLSVGAAICALAFSLLYQRYQGVLAASELPSFKEGKLSPERAGYDKLRCSLADETAIARIYAKRLTAFLDWAERFFGDEGRESRGPFHHFLQLQRPSPLWTAAAFDRCLLLALLYPILTIFLIWGISGHVGPAEKALGLPEGVDGWQRHVAVLLLPFAIAFGYWRSTHRTKRKPSVWRGVAFAGASGGVFAFAFTIALSGVLAFPSSSGGVAVAVAVSTAVSTGFVGTVAVVSAIACTTAIASTASRNEFVSMIVVLSINAAVIFVLVVVVSAFSQSSKNNSVYQIFLTTFFAITTAYCFVAPYWLSPDRTWNVAGPLLLFLGLLTLINAPFDWLSLGLTRALLRRGLELKGWWPLGLALLDAALAVLIVAALSIAMILGVQAFDGAAVLGGGKATLSVADILAGIGNPQTAGEPEYWWVYALLLSTMIPSMINLAIGGMALMRGIPGLRRVLHRQLPEGTHVSKDERKWIALLLAFQDVFGVVLGIGAQALIFWLLFAYVLPSAGLGLLEMANDIAALDLPRRALTARLSAI